MKLDKVLQNFTAFNKISWYNYFDFNQFCCILLSLTFAFDDFERLLQNFGLARTGSKFGNFRPGNRESLKKIISQLPT
jgi:hypothetical protein